MKIQGFTYVELLLYIAIIVIIFSALLPFTLQIISHSEKSKTLREVQDAASYMGVIIKKHIKDSTDINSVSSTSISLATANAATNPTVIDVSSGVMRVTQGSGNPISLHSSHILVGNVTFTNVSSVGGASKNIEAAFTVNANYGIGRQEYQYSTNVIIDAEVRNN